MRSSATKQASERSSPAMWWTLDAESAFRTDCLQHEAAHESTRDSQVDQSSQPICRYLYTSSLPIGAIYRGSVKLVSYS